MNAARQWNTESEVEARFCEWLAGEGWTDIERASGTNYLDVSAWKDGRRLVAESKGVTKDTGTDVDTLYGQILRRMEDPAAAYALVVPEGNVLESALRVEEWVRRRLGLTIYSVAEDGAVLGTHGPWW